MLASITYTDMEKKVAPNLSAVFLVVTSRTLVMSNLYLTSIVIQVRRLGVAGFELWASCKFGLRMGILA